MSQVRFIVAATVAVFLAVFLYGIRSAEANAVADALKQAQEHTSMTTEKQELPGGGTAFGASRAEDQVNHANIPSPDEVNEGPEQAVYPGVTNGHLESGGSGTPTSSVYYPIFGKSAIDAEIKSFAEDAQASYFNEIKDIVKDMEESGESVSTWEQAAFFTLEKASPDIASITFNIYNYTGGAHGQIYVVVLNYDLKTGRRLALADLFGKPEKAISIMSEICARELKNTLGEDADEEMIADGTKPEESNFANLSLLADGIAVEFQPYQVGPWSIGQQEVKISLSDLAAAEPNAAIWPKK